MEEPTYCIRCKRPILDHEIDLETGIAYCYGCNYYFPLQQQSVRRRAETVIPGGASYIRLRIFEDEVRIRIRWIRNYNFRQLFFSDEQTENFILYKLLAWLINRTEIKASRRFIYIRHLPLDTLPTVFYGAYQVEGLYVKLVPKELLARHNLLVQYFVPVYGLFGRLAGGKEQLWIWGLRKRALLFIEQEVERAMGIEDQEVAGEITCDIPAEKQGKVKKP